MDEVAVSKDSTESLSTPTGGGQTYRRLALKFSVRLLERVRRRRTSPAHDVSSSPTARRTILGARSS